MSDADVVAVHGDWLVRADRGSVYAIVSDFERMPERFPKIARSIRLVYREGDVLTLEAEAGSFASWLPTARIELTVTLLPGQGYRCTTRNLTFNTTGDEVRSCSLSTTRRVRASSTRTSSQCADSGSTRCSRGGARPSGYRSRSGRSSIRWNRS